MLLRNIDIASVPTEHLASLASCVEYSLAINNNVSNCDLGSILGSVKCELLCISNRTLSREETQALVRAMESRVEWVRLGYSGDESLDMTALTQYSGHGKCRFVLCFDDRYKEDLSSWAEKNNWYEYRSSYKSCLMIQR